MRLVKPIDPCTFESLASLLERSRQENHYSASNWLQTLPKSISRQPPNLLRAVSDFQHLAELMELEIETLFDLTLHRFVACYYLPEAWPVWPLEHDDLPAPLWEISGLDRFVHGQRNEKICPRCWEEQHALLLPWSLRHITTCPTHGIFLVDRCCACGQTLGIDQAEGQCATCGLDLTKLPIIDLGTEPESLELSHLLWSAIGCSASPFPPMDGALDKQHPLWTMPRAALLQFLWYGGQFVLKRDPHHPVFEWPSEGGYHVEEDMTTGSLRCAEVRTVHTVLLAMWNVLKGWPQTWYTLLEWLVQHEEPLSTTPTTCIPAVFKAQFPNEAFTWLHQGTADFMWRTPGMFVQLSVWLRYWESTQREKRQTKRSEKRLQRTVNLLGLSFPNDR